MLFHVFYIEASGAGQHNPESINLVYTEAKS